VTSSRGTRGCACGVGPAARAPGRRAGGGWRPAPGRGNGGEAPAEARRSDVTRSVLWAVRSSRGPRSPPWAAAAAAAGLTATRARALRSAGAGGRERFLHARGRRHPGAGLPGRIPCLDEVPRRRDRCGPGAIQYSARRVRDGRLVLDHVPRGDRTSARHPTTATGSCRGHPAFMCPTPIGVAVAGEPIRLQLELLDMDGRPWRTPRRRRHLTARGRSGRPVARGSAAADLSRGDRIGRIFRAPGCAARPSPSTASAAWSGIHLARHQARHRRPAALLFAGARMAIACVVLTPLGLRSRERRAGRSERLDIAAPASCRWASPTRSSSSPPRPLGRG